MFLNPFGIISRIGMLLLVGYIGWQGWVNLGPGKNPRQDLADRAIPIIIEDLRNHRGEMRAAALLPFTGDSSGYFNETIRETILRQGTFELAEPGVIDQLKVKLGIAPGSVELPEDAVAAARNMDVDCVIFGRIDQFESFAEGAQLDVTYYIANVESGETVQKGRYFEDTSKPNQPSGIADSNAGDGNDSSVITTGASNNVSWWVRRAFSWSIVVLLLPVFTIGFIKSMVSRRSNKVNAFVLGIYTVADALLAYILVGPAIGSLWPLVGFGTAVLVAFLYNVQLMTYALKLSEE